MTENHHHQQQQLVTFNIVFTHQQYYLYQRYRLHGYNY